MGEAVTITPDAPAVTITPGSVDSNPSFWNNPKAFFQKRAGEMGQEAQRQMNMAIGPESEKRSTLAKLGHSLLSLAPETAGVVDKLIAGGMDWKNALVMASGAVDPAIPAAYFGAHGTAQLTGLEPGIEKGNTSPENVQNAALAGATVAGGAAAAASPTSGSVLKPAVARAALLGKTPVQAYESAMKPSTTLSEAERAEAAQTGIQQGIPVSKGGLSKLSDLVDDLNSKISDQIKTGSAQGVKVDPQAVAARTAETTQKFATQVNPTADLQAIEDSKAEFLKNNPNPLSAEDAQAMKQGTYRVLGGKAYGEQGSATVEAQKALARGLKEELAQQFPEIQGLNAQESRLLDLQPLLERAVARIGNHQLLGIGTPITVGATKALTGSGKMAAVAGVMKAVLDDPYIKSRLAISLGKAGVPPAQIMPRISTYEAGLATAAGGHFASSGNDESQPTQ